jgi:hypothetical protein
MILTFQYFRRQAGGFLHASAFDYIHSKEQDRRMRSRRPNASATQPSILPL